MYIRTEGVILAYKNFQEADRLLTIFTRDHGKISCIAKGARRPRSKKAGHVELGNWCKIFVAKGKNIDLLTEIEVKRPFGLENLDKEQENQIYHFLELVDHLTATNQKNIRIFSLLVNFLKKVSRGDDFKLLSTVFKVKLLKELGFFSAQNLKSINLKNFFNLLEEAEFEEVREKINLNDTNYLKLSNFLDSMIESLSEKRLKTSRFLNGQV